MNFGISSITTNSNGGMVLTSPHLDELDVLPYEEQIREIECKE